MNINLNFFFDFRGFESVSSLGVFQTERVYVAKNRFFRVFRYFLTSPHKKTLSSLLFSMYTKKGSGQTTKKRDMYHMKRFLAFITTHLGASALLVSPPETEPFLSSTNTVNPVSGANFCWYSTASPTLSGSNYIGQIYYLEGSPSGIVSSPALFPVFQTSQIITIPSYTGSTAWYADTISVNASFSGNIYFLSGSTSGITASAPLSLSFNTNTASLISTTLPNNIWYCDNNNPNAPAGFNANIYYITGSTSTPSYQSLSNLSFQSSTSGLIVDINPVAAWYFDDSSLPLSGSQYNGNLYYLIGSDTSLEASSAFIGSFNGPDTYCIADTMPNVAWYIDTLPPSLLATVYYLEGSVPHIASSSTTLSFQTNYISGAADIQPAELWYFDVGNNAPGFHGNIYHLSGSLSGIDASSAVNCTFTTSFAYCTSTAPNTSWYFDAGSIAQTGLIANIYFLENSSSGLTATYAALPFLGNQASCITGNKPNTAWYFDSPSTIVLPSANIYYLTTSGNAINYTLETLPLNSSLTLVTPDFTANGCWVTGGVIAGTSAPYISTVYYIDATSTPLTKSQAQLSFNSNSVNISSQNTHTAFIGDAASLNSNIYFLQYTPSGIAVSGWTSGVNGALLNSALNSLVTHTQALQSRLQRPSNAATPSVSYAQLPLNELLTDLQPHNVQSKTSPRYLFQLTAFYDYIKQHNQGVVPGFFNNITGGLATLDAHFQPLIIGGGFAYSRNHAKLMEGFGKANIHQETGVFYLAWENYRLAIDAACWGGLYQMHGERAFAGALTSRYSTQGYTLTPHIQIKGFMFAKDHWFTLDPFASVDWPALWQKNYTEHSPAGSQLHNPSLKASLLRSEAGVYITQKLKRSWGCVTFLEKASYINQLPFQHNTALPLLVGSTAPFSISTGSIATQNLCSLEFQAAFNPPHQNIPLLGMDLQAEFGSKLQSYFAALKIGKIF